MKIQPIKVEKSISVSIRGHTFPALIENDFSWRSLWEAVLDFMGSGTGFEIQPLDCVVADSSSALTSAASDAPQADNRVQHFLYVVPLLCLHELSTWPRSFARSLEEIGYRLMYSNALSFANMYFNLVQRDFTAILTSSIVKIEYSEVWKAFQIARNKVPMNTRHLILDEWMFQLMDIETENWWNQPSETKFSWHWCFESVISRMILFNSSSRLFSAPLLTALSAFLRNDAEVSLIWKREDPFVFTKNTSVKTW